MEEPQSSQTPAASARPVPTVVGEDGRPQPVEFEETPLLHPIVEDSETETVPPGIEMPRPAEPPPAGLRQALGNIGLFVLLFMLGLWLSTIVRPFLAGREAAPTPGASQGQIGPSPTPSTAPIDVYTDWKTYAVISGATKKPVGAVNFKLPATVAAPVCDSGSCASQGTSLPGGTRFTVAPRGEGQLLVDFRGGLLTDISGQPFTLKQATISGYPATEYTASFSGRTAGGYSFTQMRGVMVNLNDSLTLELNHFTPATTSSADFTADDELFNQILQTITFGIPTPTPTPASGSGNEPG